MGFSRRQAAWPGNPPNELDPLCFLFFYFLSMDPFVAANNRGDYKQGRRLLVGSLDWKVKEGGE